MTHVTIEQAMQIAVARHQAGQLAEAQGIYRQVLARKPDHAEALHLLGVVARQVGRPDTAVELIQRSIQLNAASPEAHAHSGDALRDLGKWDQATAAYSRAISLSPNWAEVHGLLGNCLREQKKLNEAIAAYRQAISINPNLAEAHFNLGIALHEQGKIDLAIGAYRRALEIKSDFAEACNSLGNALSDQGKIDAAIDAYNRAISIKPAYAEAYSNLGIALKNQGKIEQAIAAYQQATVLNPRFFHALNNLGNALKDRGKLDDAVAAYRRAIDVNPHYADAFNNLGNAMKDAGDIEQAIACYDRAMALKPDDPVPHSNRLCAIHFHPGYDSRAIHEDHRRWNARFAEPIKRYIQPHANDHSPGRRLRIGYVSSNFREHPIGRFMLPLLEAHDHGTVEVFCYSDSDIADSVTGQLAGFADAWRKITGLSDEQAADLIRQDRIDVLIDLTMHMAHNRLLLFARKPVPVQVTYLAYCSTTGLDTMDYRLTDPHVDPPGGDDTVYSEASIRLPETCWCYRPGITTPVPRELPAIRNGYITFGSLNNFSKVSTDTLQTWRTLLQAIPNSRIIVHTAEGSHREHVREVLGNDAGRLEFVGFLSSEDYFHLYGRIDIALDPFPYVGGTTTCDALWMGVPVITLAGRTAAGRPGVSMLNSVGVAELIAPTMHEYVTIAQNLATDLDHLRKLRMELRERMQSSPLMNAPRFARHIEAAYREMWKGWCGTG